MLLRALSLLDEHAAVRAEGLLSAEEFGFLPLWQSTTAWPDYVRFLEAVGRGKSLPEGWVRTTFLVGQHEGRIVGRISLRHELTSSLLEWGGHIGYAVLPEYRGQGFAKAMVKAVLPRAASSGLQRVLVTCDDTNIASARVIEASGGVLEDTRPMPDSHRLKRRYWIPVPPGTSGVDALEPTVRH